MTNTVTDQPTDLVTAVVEQLWRLYGYDPGIDGRHPETERVFRLDAVCLIEGIERAGYRIVAPGTVVLRYADSEVLLPGFDPDNAAPEDKL